MRQKWTLLTSVLVVWLHAQSAKAVVTADLDSSKVDASDLDTSVSLPPSTRPGPSSEDQFGRPSHNLGTLSASLADQVFSRQDTEWAAIGAALEDAVVASGQCVKQWATFLVLVAVPLLRAFTVLLEEVALPHVVKLATIGVNYVSKMDPLHQALLAAAVLLVAVCVRQGYVRKARVQYSMTKRKLELRYRTFVASLSAKWRVVAKLLPHVLFFALSFEVLFWLPDSTTNVLGSKALFSLLSVGYPLMHTIRVIRHKRFNLKHDKSTPPTSKAGCTRQLITKFDKACIPGDEWRAYEASLKYWVIWSFAVCLTSIITLVLPTFVTSYCKVPLLLCNVSLVWMHSSFTRGDIALYALLSPLISPHASRLYERKAAVDAEADERTNFLMRILVSFGVVPERHVYLAKDLWSQGPALFGLIFMFTPGFVTSRGCLLMAFGFPAYATIGVLSEKRTRRYEWWLAYYCVAIMTDYLITAIGDEVKWLPLFYHVKLLVMMWLQFPYFQGAERLFNASFSSVFIDPEFKNE